MPRPTGLGTFIGQMVNLDEYKRPPSMSIVRRELERLAAAWDERQRRQTSTMPFPAYQTATGYFPAVPRPPTSAFQPQAGPHWLPPQPGMLLPPQSGTLPPPFQQTGMVRSAGPSLPYPSPAMPPMPARPRRRRRLGRWGIFLIILLIVLVVFILSLIALAQGQPPTPVIPGPGLINGNHIAFLGLPKICLGG
jgi:hypothetical protein